MYKVEEIRRKSLEIAKNRGISTEHIRFYWEDAGSETGASVRRNKEIISKIFFKQRIIHDVEPSTETEFFGVKVKTPIMIAPMRMMETYIENGIPKMAAAAKETETILWMGAPMPRGTTKDYIHLAPMVHINKCNKDRELLLTRLREAEECGCVGVGVDVDSSGGLRLEHRPINRSKLPWKPLSISELRALRKEINVPFIVKGVLSVSDARSAVEAGADAIVVSNHGGCNVDYSQVPFVVLPKIKEAVADKLDIYYDSQIRRGSDVLKALALGAKGVLIGCTVVWAVFANGSEGIVTVIDTMTEDLKRAMLYTGIESVENVSKDILVMPRDVFG